jgi:hypothetical protein
VTFQPPRSLSKLPFVNGTRLKASSGVAVGAGVAVAGSPAVAPPVASASSPVALASTTGAWVDVGGMTSTVATDGTPDSMGTWARAQASTAAARHNPASSERRGAGVGIRISAFISACTSRGLIVF